MEAEPPRASDPRWHRARGIRPGKAGSRGLVARATGRRLGGGRDHPAHEGPTAESRVALRSDARGCGLRPDGCRHPGGNAADAVGGTCLCSALLADSAAGRIRKGGSGEPPLVTRGDDLAPGVRRLEPGRSTHSATDVLALLLGTAAPDAAARPEAAPALAPGRGRPAANRAPSGRRRRSRTPPRSPTGRAGAA